jgi:purine-nucleoside phosphorylase
MTTFQPSATAQANLRARACESASALGFSRGDSPRAAIVLGSGLNDLAGRVENARVIPYDRVPHFPVPKVAGHAGRVICGKIAGQSVIVFQGRFHYYEGHDLDTVTFPVRVIQEIGIPILILTAATGGIRDGLRPGNLLLISDHLNLMGVNPLRGPNDDRLGTRFPDMSEVYSRRLRTIALDEGQAMGIELVSGVYACMSGPSYETPAEIRMLRTLGADVVGMSTVPEAIVARHAGIEVLAFALVSNAAAGVSGAPITHEEVLEAGKKAGPELARLIERVVARVSPVE